VSDDINKINSALNRINERMDSFVDQITQLKMFHHKKTDDIHKEMIKKIESYSEYLRKYDNISEIKKDLKKDVEKFFNDKVKEVNDSKSEFILDLISRFNNLESYIKNERFHSILVELNKLEDEYHDKAVKMVKKMAIKKQGKHHE